MSRVGEEVSIEQSGDYTLFEYDLLNRMVSANKIDEDTGTLRQVVSYRYNHKNLRIERTDDEGTTRYVFDLAGNIIEEHDAERLTRYVFRNNKHLAKITPDGKTYYYGTDNLGSTTVLFDEDGDVVWKGEISAFGDVVLGEWIGEELFDERVRFTGKDYDEVTGLYYFNARWYDPRLGRFTSEDPVRDGMNWHVYTYNNPLKYTDPTGLDPHNMTIEEADRRGWTYPADRKPSSGDDDSNRPLSKQLKKRKTGDSFGERVRKCWNGGWKQQRMEGDNFIPERTYSPKEIDSLYLLYKLDHAIMIATREGLIDQPTAENYRNAIGDATILVLYGPSGGDRSWDNTKKSMVMAPAIAVDGPIPVGDIIFGIVVVAAVITDIYQNTIIKERDFVNIMYHYSPDASLSSVKLFSGTFVTPDPSLSSKEAIQKLGLKYALDTQMYVYTVPVKNGEYAPNPFSNPGNRSKLTPNDQVPDYPSRPGGGFEFILTVPKQPTGMRPARER